MIIFVLLANIAVNASVNACSTLAFISAITWDGFGGCFVVPVVLHFGDTVAVLILVKYVLLLVVRNSGSYANTFFDITRFFISYLLNGWIDLLIIYSTQSGQTQLTCDQV